MRPGPDPRSQRRTVLRVGILGLFLALGLVAVCARVFALQVLRRGSLDDEMVDQYRRQFVLKPRRGVVTDRAGVLLAQSADAQSVFADPVVLDKDVRGAEALRKVTSALSLDLRQVKRKLSRGTRFVWIARRVSPAESAAVERVVLATGVRGIALVPETRRYYPKVELASQLLGFVGEDGEGQEGIELSRDEDLRGEAIRIRSLRDGAGRMALAEAPDDTAREGARIELTIDQGVELATERALGSAVRAAHALSGVAVVLDPHTGEVLAMANYPPMNPNAPKDPELARNRAVTDTFEPGSTMKVFTLAGALDRGTLRPNDPIDTGNGSLTIGDHVIHDHAALGWIGPAKILAVSSNVGAARIGSRLGRAALAAAQEAFGFGEKPGVGLPGEGHGLVPVPRSDLDLATQSFGYHLLASPLQITSAFSAIANGGTLLQTHIVKRVVDSATGEVLEEARAEPIRQAVSPGTAATISRWLAGVVEDPSGTGHRAALPGYRVAGKTGTARKTDPVSGGYVNDRHLSSFVGFAPLEDPRVVVGIWIDEPHGEIYGGEVAAPAFREIVAYSLRMLNVAPAPSSTVAGPDRDPPDREIEDPPLANTADDESASIESVAQVASHPVGATIAVPSLAGLPARAAVRSLEASELAPVLSGAGRVVWQDPPAGRNVSRGTRVRMKLAPAG